MAETLAASALPPRGAIDLPQGMLPIGASFALAGWVMAAGPVRRVRIELDGRPFAEAPVGLQRPDVARAFPAYPFGARSGFHLAGLRLPPEAGEAVTLAVIAEPESGPPLRLERRLPVLRRATDLLAQLRATPPEGPEPLLAAAGQFIAAGAFDDAEALLGVAVARFPDHPGPLAEYAHLAGTLAVAGQGPAAEAAQRLALLHRRFPDHPPGGLEEARALAGLDRYAEAEVLLDLAVRQGDARPALLELRATVAEQLAMRASQAGYLDAWRQVRECWGAVLAVLPDHVPALIGAGHAQLQTDRIAEAERFLTAAAARCPGEPMLAMWHAHAATLRGDPAEAMRRWAQLRAAFPSFDGGASLEGQARFALAETEAAPAAPPGEALDDRGLMLCFEAFGSNCEFGNVQRAFGAEPLGLFRFSSANANDLVAAMAVDFAGIGAPENTLLEIVPEPRPEFWTGDRRWHFRAHTFTYPEQVPDAAMREALLAKHCTRLQFLRRKLLEDLEAAEKIVLHADYGHSTPDSRHRMFTALRRHGPNTLLYVVPADAGHPSGSLEVVEEGLMLGRLDGFVGISRATMNLPDWLKLCRAAHALWQGWRRQ